MNKKYRNSNPDPWAETRPNQAVRLELDSARKRRGCLPIGCLTIVFIIAIIAAYFLFPSNQTILILGIDRSFENTAIGRSDTNILLGVRPLPGTVSVLSIPRDLWVNIPGYGENRINAAHFFGENDQAGTGPQLAVATIEDNFDLQVDHYVRIQLENFPQVVDAMGGVEIELETAMAGYPAGTHLLNGTEALAFVRDRAGTDDFFRMAQGQVFLKSFMRTLLNPSSVSNLPGILIASLDTIDTDIPIWQLPRVAVAVLRSYLTDQIEFVIIQREMVVPWLTPAGAQVLLPDWAQIQPLVRKEFGQ
ncbi:MAG TPA: LCP family protein [Anaerolineales bacterium]|jgi:LCP family protein required for cell wall assembly|nr:LCP family protein [Anaerolineales bacterium]